MKNIFSSLLLFLLFSVLITGCKKESEQLNTPAMTDYFPLEVGKVFYYRLDSTVLANFGTRFITKSYLIKDTIESTFTDNIGRPSYRIYRFITDVAETQGWTFSNTIVATPTFETIEYIENNLRFLKLHAPVTDGYKWKAHQFIDTKSDASPVKFLDEWEYEYQNIGQPFTDTVLNKTYDNTATILQADNFDPYGPFDPQLSIQERKYGIEVYAKGVGMVYKDFLQWTWQHTYFEDEGYGVTMWLVRHN